MRKYKLLWELLAIIALCFILVFTIYLFPESWIRKVIGLPFILFFSGYVLISFLFPRREDLDSIERVALSFGLSIAISPLIGLGLNYTPFGIRLTPILFFLSLFIICFALLAIYRRMKVEDPFTPPQEINVELGESRLDRILTIILIAAIIISIALLIYIIVTPQHGEEFTEFYLLGPQGKAADYPQELEQGEKASVIVGIANHEYRTIDYTIEVWLTNTTMEYNQTSEKNETRINYIQYMNSFNVTLNHTETSVEGNWTPQYQTYYNFSVNRSGDFKLWFLLFKDSYQRAENNSEAKERLHRAIEGDILSLNLNLDVK